MIGKRIGGRYQIIRELGGGGFGKTFVAQDQHLPGTPACVVKQLKPQTAGGSTLEAARGLFNREAKFLYQLGTHERIPQLFAHFEEDQEFYLVQEFIEGHELKQELPPHQTPFNEAQVVTLLQEILEVLGFVHQQNVIHRDLKPSNLLRRHSDGKLVLIDFGAVKQVSTQSVQPSHHTSFTIAIGSPGYMPSEQLAGKPRFCSDIYAVGMIGIQALTGINPRSLPEDPNTGEIIWQEGRKVSQTLTGILNKMVCYDFRDRYQSVLEVLENLELLQSRRSSPFLSIPVIAGKPPITSPETLSILIDDLTSECGIDYTKLRDFLAASCWQEADAETYQIMLKATQRVSEGFLRAKDIRNFSCQDLQTLNNLWSKYSQEKFGFGVQKKLWDKVSCKVNSYQELELEFGNHAGWRINGQWLNYNDLNFSLEAGKGYLPRRCFWGIEGLRWSAGMDAPRMTLSDFFAKIETCQFFNESSIILPKNEVISISDDIQTEKKINYDRLKDLLAAGNWKAADQETKLLLLTIARKEVLTSEDINQFPCQDLQIIDELWFKYSNGKFGFSVQQRIWKNLGGSRYAHSQTICHFGLQVGWFVEGNWLLYNHLNFSLEAPEGHLPVADLRGKGRRIWGLIWAHLFDRFEACQSHQVTATLPTIKPENLEDFNDLRVEQFSNQVAPSNPLIKNRIEVIQGDIIQQNVEAIVNSTDVFFSGIGQVDRAIHQAAGPELRVECSKLGHCTKGTAKITQGYNLPAQWIIHTVGPTWQGGNKHEQDQLAECYQNCLILAEKFSIQTIAFPAISTGNLGFPIKLGARIAVIEVQKFLAKNSSIQKVIFVCFSKSDYQDYLQAVHAILG